MTGPGMPDTRCGPGFLTSAARAGASIFKMKKVARHKSLDVLAGYVRDAQAFTDHAGEDFA